MYFRGGGVLLFRGCRVASVWAPIDDCIVAPFLLVHSRQVGRAL